MTTSEIERLVTATLRHHAEDAMNRTDTEHQLGQLLERIEPEPRSRRTLVWVIGLVAAAALAVVGVVAVWPSDDDPVPAPPTPSESEQVAQQFAEAWFAYDRGLAASYVAEGVTEIGLGNTSTGPGSWRVLNQWWQAWGMKPAELDDCQDVGETATGVEVGCTFSWHGLGSDRLGRGPYDNNLFTIVVDEGQVVDADVMSNNAMNGFNDEMWNPLTTWAAETYPQDEALLYAFEDPDAGATRVARSHALWTQRIDQYVAAVQAGEAD